MRPGKISGAASDSTACSLVVEHRLEQRPQVLVLLEELLPRLPRAFRYPGAILQERVHRTAEAGDSVSGIVVVRRGGHGARNGSLPGAARHFGRTATNAARSGPIIAEFFCRDA